MNDVANRFAAKVFNLATMRQRLPKDTYREMLRCIGEGKRMDLGIANIVGRMAILAEGDATRREDIIYLEKLPLFDSDGNPLD